MTGANRNNCAAALTWLLAAVAQGESPTRQPLTYAVGADVSFLDHAVSQGASFSDGDSEHKGLELLKHSGFNWIRLRLFVAPDELPNDFEYTKRLAVRAKRLGFKVLLDFHYSDTWADPGKQYTPGAWKGLPIEELCERVRSHTRESIEGLARAGAAPDMVQIGNEVTNGMLWPQGRLPNSWGGFARLVQAGVRGVQEAATPERPLVMIHIDRGGDWATTKRFLDECLRRDIEFDVIGQSYYPWWHGSLEDLRNCLHRTAARYEKDIVLVEVAYHWRRGVYEPGAGPFPETPAGQRDFLTTVERIVRETPDNRGKGVFWWEPAVEPGPIYSRGLFDSDGVALPALSVLAGASDPQVTSADDAHMPRKCRGSLVASGVPAVCSNGRDGREEPRHAGQEQ